MAGVTECGATDSGTWTRLVWDGRINIKQISVTQLFGLFDHTIPLNKQDHVTVIYGPNGIGKTALLRFVDGFCNQQYAIFRKIPFGEFRIDFDDGNCVTVKRRPSEQSYRMEEIVVESPGHEDEPFLPEAMVLSKDDYFVDRIRLALPRLRLLEGYHWLDEDGRVFSSEEIYERYSHLLPQPQHLTNYMLTPRWLKSLVNDGTYYEFPLSYLVETSRLLQDPDAKSSDDETVRQQYRPVSAINKDSSDVASRIQAARSWASTRSQSLDQTFPTRLVSQLREMKRASLTSQRLQNELKEIEGKRERLATIGLIDKSGESEAQLPDKLAMNNPTRIALSIYIEDMKKSLELLTRY
jgi:energy-coupling factor transporter ATP-binding protein EcfA2